MKKYLLFIISMLCVSIGTWAEEGTLTNGSDWTYSDGVLTITFSNQSDYAYSPLNALRYTELSGETLNKVIIKTAPSFTLNTATSGSSYTQGADEFSQLDGAQIYDFSQASLTAAVGGYYPMDGNGNNRLKNVVVPDAYKTNPTEFLVYQAYTAAELPKNKYGIDGKTIYAFYNNASERVSVRDIKSDAETLKIIGNLDDIDLSSHVSGITLIDLNGVTGGSGTITVPDVDGLTVICPTQAIYSRVAISGNPGSPATVVLSTEITASDETDLTTKVDALTAAGVKPTKITYTGTLTSALLTSFSGSAYSDVKRLDMSGATLGSASLTDLQIPSALEELSLPAGQTVPDALKSRLAANSNLWYVYSTTSDPQTFAGQHTPDYVWVVKPGGLNRALNSEAKLRTAIYVKIASEVALNNDDAKFGNHGISSETSYSSDTDYPWQYVDLSGAVVTEAATLATTAPHGKTYRIILPNNLTGDHLAIFASNLNKGDVAGLYTYTGTTLKILGLSTNYSPGALADNRIVRDGTKTVEFIEGTYNSTTYGIFTPSMLAAVNNMGKTSFSYYKGESLIEVTGNTIGTQVEIVRILTNRVCTDNNNSTPNTALTFENPTIHTLNLSGLTNNATAVVNVNGCTNLVNLTIENTHIASVTGNITSSKLGNINMTNVTIEGGVSFQGAVQTSFTASGRIAGDIDLTNNNKLGSIDIVNVEFKDQYGTSTLQGSSDDASPSTGDLIITRSSVTDPTNGVYTGDTEGYTKITENIKVSETFGNGIDNTDSKDGRIYPRIAATTKAPYSTDVAGYKQDGCALTITLDGQTENYTTLAAALNLIFGTSIADGNFSSLADICNLTINTTAKDSNPRYNLTNDDIAVINSLTFSATAEGGNNANLYRMATLNLEGATLTSNTLLADLEPHSTDNAIRNIILPQGLDKSVVNATTFAHFASNANFNGAISTNASRSALVGYVQKPGSLYEIMTQVPDFRPNVYIYLPSPGINITDVTLSGKLLAVDISNGYDHLLANGNHSESIVYVRTTGAALEHQNSLSTLDIEDAIFVDAENTSTIKETNMTLSELGWASITSLKMPTDSRMKNVPKNFLNNCKLINYLCIPYNYEKIDNAAFHLSGTNWITTTDSKGAEIDNGNYTYTFSKNLKEIGTDPGNDANGYPITFGLTPVFNAVNSAQIHDIYILRNGYEDGLPFNPTKCYRGAFASGMTYGWGGFDGGSIYCREKYKNGAFLFTILNYPDNASLPSEYQYTTISGEGASDVTYGNTTYYDQMEKSYTDVTKVYTKKDQTGAVDANGDLIPWPTFSELGRAYNQAIRGLVWNDWNIVQPDQSEGNVNGGVVTFDPAAMPDAKTTVEGTPNKNQFHDYVGWHEFVLSKATYVAPDENVVGNKIYRGYQAPQFYTFCVPFDMTPAEVLNLLGVPASDDDKNIVTTLTQLEYDGEGNVTNAASVEKNTTDLYPEIYTLKRVDRTLATTSDPNKIRLGLSKNLAETEGGVYQYWMPDDNCSGDYTSNAITRAEDGVEVAGSNVMIRGGYPYLIKAYLPQGAKAQNGSLGRYVLSRYTFPMNASSAVVRRPGTFIGLHGNTYISYFARPYDQHLVRALQADPNTTTVTPATTGDGNGGTKNYNYRFLGEYWQQWMPTNTYYLYPREHKWYYNKNVTNWKWAPYVCIINADDQSYVNPDTGEYIGALTDIINGENGSVIPYSTVDDSEGHAVFTENLKLHYSTTPIDDTVFPTAGAREFYFVFDDNDIVEVGDDNVTAIESINGVDIRPVTGKVYNMAGQYVGNSLEGLSKGMYIVNGKKIVVK